MRFKQSEETIHHPEAAYLMVRNRLRYKQQEDFLVLALDAKHHVVGRPVLIARRTANRVDVHARDVFREAIRRNAVAVILVHNHPSGDAEPSMEDKALTSRMQKAGEVVGIPVLDHLVVSDSGYVAFSEKELL
uniref:Putative DNA repair protein n=1 Tax=viral metagenome TaxID=1070528 RepID=A0A6H1ZT28_9ZZZZ